MFLLKFKPAVPKTWLILIAGVLWSLVGIMLLRLSVLWLMEADAAGGVLCILAGFVLAVLFYRGILLKIALKNIERICEYTQKGCLFAFQPWRSYLLIIVMISLGFILRHSSIPKMYLSSVYIAVGGGLLAASLRYYVHLIRG